MYLLSPCCLFVSPACLLSGEARRVAPSLYPRALRSAASCRQAVVSSEEPGEQETAVRITLSTVPDAPYDGKGSGE